MMLAFWCIWPLLLGSGEAAVTIELMPTADFNAANFPGAMYFKPVSPTTSNQRCNLDTPCSSCTPQTVCGGDIDLDLSSDSQLSFVWQAPVGKEIRIDGPERSRVEFQATVPCGTGDSSISFRYQDIEGTTFTPIVEGSNTGVLRYNADRSFVEIGKCAGCSKCEVYTRVQFDGPINDARFRRLMWTVPYNQANTLLGLQTYRYGTDLYCWIRGATLSRRLQGQTDGSRQLTNGNTFSLVDDVSILTPLPTPALGSGDTSDENKTDSISSASSICAMSL